MTSNTPGNHEVEAPMVWVNHHISNDFFDVDDHVVALTCAELWEV